MWRLLHSYTMGNARTTAIGTCCRSGRSRRFHRVDMAERRVTETFVLALAQNVITGPSTCCACADDPTLLPDAGVSFEVRARLRTPAGRPSWGVRAEGSDSVCE